MQIEFLYVAGEGGMLYNDTTETITLDPAWGEARLNN